jgi:hypothetical protein
VTPAPSREPRSLPPGRALLWFGEAIRLWKRGPLAFSLIAVVVIAAMALLGPLPVVGVVVGNVVAPLLACGLLFASLAADRGEPPRVRQMLMPFAAPLRAQLAVVAAALVATLVESAVAWSIAGINLLAPGSGDVDVAPSVVIVIYATDVLVSLPLTFVPMAALFDGERLGPAFASSLRAFARNPQTMLALAAYTFILVLAGIATTGIGLVLGLPWIAAAQYAAWKDIYAVAASDGRAPGEVA